MAMQKKESEFLKTFVHEENFPLQERESDTYKALIKDIKQDLQRDGCSVLKGFLRKQWHTQVEHEGEAIAPSAYYQTETVNAYNVPLDADLAADHPAKITMQRENAFVPRDEIPSSHIIHQLFENEKFTAFLGDCFGYEKLYQLADPLAGLCINVLKPGCAHPWHFDINEFTVSMLTKKSDEGGAFRYCPEIRSPDDENLAQVRNVLLNGDEQTTQIKELDLDIGDLQLFQGRYSLHQVSAVKGETSRHSAIFAYTLEPHVIGGTARTKQLFGRVLPAHEADKQFQMRADELLD